MIEIEPLQIEHLEYRVQLLNDTRISVFLNTHEMFDLERTKSWFVNRNTDQRFDCVFKNENRVIGMGGLTSISSVNRNAELYMYLSPDFQGKGMGTKALVGLCKYAFDNLLLHKIYLYTFAENRRANHLYEKVGFCREGVLREHTLKDGRLQNRYLYGLLKNEFVEL